MNKIGKIIVVGILVILVTAVIALKNRRTSETFSRIAPEVTAQEQSVQPEKTDIALSSSALPRLVDLGADKCIPCKMMDPILEELKTEYKGVLIVDFIDVWKNPQAGKEYKIWLIPTQIFYDASGKELYRHEGFFSKEDILAKWKELGVELKKTK